MDVPYLHTQTGANRRAAVAVSGGAAERPMEPKGFAPPFASLRETSQTATGTPQQEIQEIQEMQERPVNGRRVRTLGDRQGANRRAAVAVSGGAAERPMEPKGVRASLCVFAGKEGL